jgi:hypothetical protein
MGLADPRNHRQEKRWTRDWLTSALGGPYEKEEAEEEEEEEARRETKQAFLIDKSSPQRG